jgi:hypothetical protein
VVAPNQDEADAFRSAPERGLSDKAKAVKQELMELAKNHGSTVAKMEAEVGPLYELLT